MYHSERDIIHITKEAAIYSLRDRLGNDRIVNIIAFVDPTSGWKFQTKHVLQLVKSS